MTSSVPLFSIIIPTFNRAGLIGRAIQSAQRQSISDWELLVVDDGSTDQTPDVVRRIASRDSRIRLIALEENSGLPAVPRNKGISAARGKIVAFLDSDDYWWPHHLETHVQCHNIGPAGGLCYSHLWSRRPGHPLFGLLYLPSPRQQARSRETLLKRNSIQCSGVTMPSDLLAEHGGFDESPGIAAVEDYELWLRVASSAPITFIPRITGVYSDSDGISAQRNMEQQLRNLSDQLDEELGRRSRIAALSERTWGVPAACASFGLSAIRRRVQSRGLHAQ